MTDSPILLVLAVAATLIGLAVLGSAFVVLRDRDGVARRIQSLFRRPERPPKTPGPGHYYKPYWS